MGYFQKYKYFAPYFNIFMIDKLAITGTKTVIIHHS